MRKRQPHCPHCDCDLSGRVDARVSPRTVCPECGAAVSPTQLVWRSQRARLDLVGDLPYLGKGLMWIGSITEPFILTWADGCPFVARSPEFDRLSQWT
jgi:hypothetical protein